MLLPLRVMNMIIDATMLPSAAGAPRSEPYAAFYVYCHDASHDARLRRSSQRLRGVAHDAVTHSARYAQESARVRVAFYRQRVYAHYEMRDTSRCFVAIMPCFLLCRRHYFDFIACLPTNVAHAAIAIVTTSHYYAITSRLIQAYLLFHRYDYAARCCTDASAMPIYYAA